MTHTRREIVSGPMTVRVTLKEGRLSQVDFPNEIPDEFTSEHLRDVLAQLGRLELIFDQGTPFQQKTWSRMQKIPWGSALTYGQLASQIGSPRAVRAIGAACGANPLPLIVPCHRVLAEDGIGGFSGGLHWKQKLLELESEG